MLDVLDAEAIDVDYAFYVTPFCEKGDLDDLLECGPVGPLEAVEIVSRVCAGVSYLHGQGLVHRDLKASNILRDLNEKPIIGDFGSVRTQNANGHATSLTKHSLVYRPPEDFLSNDFFVQGDVYQLGIILFQLLGGFFPYHEREWLTESQKKKYDQLPVDDAGEFARKKLEDKIISGRLLDLGSLPIWVPKSLKTIIRRASRKERLKRYQTVSELRMALHDTKPTLLNWVISENEMYVSKNDREFKVNKAQAFSVHKKVGIGKWRCISNSVPSTLAGAVQLIEAEWQKL